MRTALVWLGAGALAVAMASGGCGGSKGSGGDFAGGDGGSSSSGGSSSGADGSWGGSSGSSSGSSSGGGSSTSSGGLQFTSAVTIIVEPSDDAAALVSAIQGATTSVHMEMYLLSSNAVIDAVIAQSKAGKDVKVLLNETFPATGADSGSNTSVYTQLQNAGVNVKWAPAGFTYTHEKGVMLDAKVAWIMTMNATESSPTANREYLAVDTDAVDVAEAEEIFASDFADTSLLPKGKLVVSPTNSENELVSLIQMAKSTIDMEAEELTDTAVVDALTTAAGKGVKVRAVLADSTSTDQAPALKAAGVSLVTYSALYIHAKSIVVDDTYAYVGSENFSAGSLGDNRELGVLLNTPSEVAKVESTTSSDFAGGTAL